MRSPTKSNPRNVMRRAILEVVIPQYVHDVDIIEQTLSVPLNLAVSEFFQVLATFMGTVEGLPPDTPGFIAWKPLSLEYERKKQTAAFWLYTYAPGRDAKSQAADARIYAKMRKNSAGKIGPRANPRAKIYEDTLIAAVSRIDGLDALGGVIVDVQPVDPVLKVYWRGLLQQTNERQDIQAFHSNMDAKNPKALIGSYSRSGAKLSLPDGIENMKSSRLVIKFQLWSKILAKQFSRVESFLVDGGFLDQDQAKKLIGRPEYHRPLILPFMAYYSQIVLPAIMNDAVRGLTRGMGKPSSGAYVITITGNKFIGTI